MSGFFEQARRNLEPGQPGSLPRPESQWLKKVRVVSTTVPMLPPQIAPGVFEALSSAVYKDQWLGISYRNAKGQTKHKKIMPLGIAQLYASLIGGWLYDTFNNQVPFYFGSLTALLSAFLMFLFYKRGKHNGTSHA